jgi:hypothetical protein
MRSPIEPRLVPSAAASAAMCSGARSRIASIVRGSIVAFVSACGIPRVQTRVWQTMRWSANSVEPTAEAQRITPSASASRSRSAGG